MVNIDTLDCRTLLRDLVKDRIADELSLQDLACTNLSH